MQKVRRRLTRASPGHLDTHMLVLVVVKRWRDKTGGARVAAVRGGLRAAKAHGKLVAQRRAISRLPKDIGATLHSRVQAFDRCKGGGGRQALKLKRAVRAHVELVNKLVRWSRAESARRLRW